MPSLAHSPATPAQQQQHDAQFEFLQAAFVEYAGALRETCVENNRSRLLNLTAQLQAKGVHGSHALQLIQQYSAQINWQGMTPDVFNSFYRFVYFICREPNKRNVQVSTAVAAWRMVLRGRFRLLDRWCSYVATHKASVVLEDTWRQVLDFSRTVHEDLSNYDPASAWPVLLDEFVEHLKGGRRPGRPPPLAVEAADLLAPWAGRGMTAMSPRSGSKRRPPDVMEVADQLQQLPLLSTCEQLAPAGGAAAAAAADTDGGSGSTLQRQLLPKRLRMGMMGPPPPQQQQHHQQHQAGTSPAADAVMHGRRLAGGVNLFAAAFGLDGSMQVPYHQQQQLQQAESDGGSLSLTPGAYTAVHGGSSSRVVAAGGAAGPAYALPAGLILREAGQGLQQQQQHGLGMHQQQQQQHEQQHQMDVSLIPDACGSQDMMDVAPEQHAGQCLGLDHHQQQQQQQRSSTPPAVSPAAGHLAAGQLPAGHLLSQDAEGMRRISPLMQVTVTEALGLH